MAVKEEKGDTDFKGTRNIFKNVGGILKILIVIIPLTIVATTIFIISHNKGNMTISVSSTLQDIIEISDLSTVDYTYNAIATKYKDDTIEDESARNESSNIEYHVLYEGVVTAGVDFKDVLITIDDKVISIKLPDAKINETKVEMGTMEYIHVNKTEESNSISQEAYKLCLKDLKEQAENEKEILKNAKDNAKSAIEALLKPWIESLDEEYRVEID